jgi:hypothetical protein
VLARGALANKGVLGRAGLALDFLMFFVFSAKIIHDN